MRALGFLTLVAIIVACGGGGTDPGPVVANMTLSPATIDSFHSAGLTRQLTVSATDADGAPISNPRVDFSTQNAAVATVSPTGLITIVGNGTTDIRATAGSVVRSVTVKVRRKVTRITLTPAPTTVGVSQTRALTVLGFDANNREITGLAAGFQSDNTSFVTVGGTGIVTGVALGSARVTATVTTVDGTFTAASDVTVVTFPNTATVLLRAASFDPNVVDIIVGGTVTFSNTSGVEHNINFSSQVANVPNHISGSNPRTFNTPGTVTYSCNLHAGMDGSVIIH
jgi:plastocyanin